MESWGGSTKRVIYALVLAIVAGVSALSGVLAGEIEVIVTLGDPKTGI